MANTCLFSAPFAFIPGLTEAYGAVLPTEFREIWKRDGLRANPNLVAWVPNPGQGFVIDDAVLDLFPALRVISSPSTGRNHIDTAACQRRGISVYSLLDDRSGLETISASAEFTFLLLLNALRRLDTAVGEVHAGRWRDREDDLRGNELYGKSVGLVGLGRIGRRMARWCHAFDAQVAYHDPHVDEPSLPRKNLPELFATSDIVVICCVLTDQTRAMVGRDLLERLRPGAVLVNTSRGEMIDEQALAAVVRERPDLRVVLDVVCGEVTSTQFESPLISLHKEGRIVVTPHIAGATVESQRKAAMIALGLLRRHMAQSG